MIQGPSAKETQTSLPMCRPDPWWEGSYNALIRLLKEKEISQTQNHLWWSQVYQRIPNKHNFSFFFHFYFILFFPFSFYFYFYFGPNSILSQSNKKNPKPPILTDPFNLRILDQSLQAERRVWQTWLVALGRERIIITQGKTEAKWIEMIETGLTGRRCEDAKWRRKEKGNDARKNKRRMTPCPQCS